MRFAQGKPLLSVGVVFASIPIFDKTHTMENTSPKVSEMLPAIWWRRLIGFIIDNIILQLIFFVVFVILELIWPGILSTMDGVVFMISIFIVLTYYFALEWLGHTTIGKWIVGLKVVTRDKKYDKQGMVKKIAIRTLCRFIPFDHFSFISTYPNGWHDTISGTRVVLSKSIPSD